MDDGSTDQTILLLGDALAASCLRSEVIELGTHRGKGAALRAGMLATDASTVGFVDTDLSTPVGEIERCFAIAETGEADVVIATRARPASVIVERQSLARELAGKSFNLWVRGLGLTSMPDTQCGLKVFDGSIRASALRATGHGGLRLRCRGPRTGATIGRPDRGGAGRVGATSCRVGFTLCVTEAGWRSTPCASGARCGGSIAGRSVLDGGGSATSTRAGGRVSPEPLGAMCGLAWRPCRCGRGGGGNASDRFAAHAPNEWFRSTTATGGDLGGHWWWPRFLSAHAFAHGWPSAWSDWTAAGLPLGWFYFPTPALLIAFSRT